MSYRRLTHRGLDGTMQYSELYRCSGCSVTFSDPQAWREGPADSPTADAGVDEVQTDQSGPTVVVPGPASMSTWGMTPTGAADPTAFGYNEADCRAIKETADRATRSKGRRR